MITPTHPRWKEFTDRLGGPEGCNFREVKGQMRWDCGGGWDKTKARKILETMGFLDGEIADSLEFFEAQGGHCDCEILFNVDVDDEEESA